MGLNEITASVFAMLADNAKVKSQADRELEANCENIEKLANAIMEIDWLLQMAPNPETDQILIDYAATKRELMSLLVTRNKVLQYCMSAFDEFSWQVKPYLN